jgi:all-trans-nonaprenyl-diphosphate synthase
LAIVHETRGIERSRDLARHHAEIARQNLGHLEPSESKEALDGLVDYVLRRCN